MPAELPVVSRSCYWPRHKSTRQRNPALFHLSFLAGWFVLLTVPVTELRAFAPHHPAASATQGPAAGCGPISNLPCEQVRVSLPLSLEFTGSEGGLANTGFTMAAAPSSIPAGETNPVPGLDAGKIVLQGGRLLLTTSSGIAYLTNNSQINALGVQFNASQPLHLEATLVNPYGPGTAGQQGGVWFGLDDKTFVKLVVANNRVEMRREINDVSSSVSGTTNPDQRITGTLSGIGSQTVRLRLVVDPVAQTIEGLYSTNGTTYLSVGASYPTKTLSLAGTGMLIDGAYGGIFATHRKGTPLTYTYENFSLTSLDPPANAAPVFTNTPYQFSVPETAAIGASVGTVSAADAPGQSITYAITHGNQAGKFSLDPATGSITLAAALNYNEASTYSLTVSATDNANPPLATSTTVAIAVTQQNVAAPLNASTTALSFGAQLVNTSSQPQIITLTHGGPAGSANITLQTVTSDNPAFTLTQPAHVELSPGASTSVSVRFTPPAPGPVHGTLTIPHSGTTSPLIVSLSGEGTTSPTSITQIDFQPPAGMEFNGVLTTGETHPGYIADLGLPYDDTRGYGWIDAASKAPKNNQAYARERTGTDELRLRTYNHMRHPSAGASQYADWEYKVPNGMYEVTVAVGDANAFDSQHYINAEGVSVISNFVPSSQDKYRVATVTVQVSDGRLTIDANGGAANNNTKIGYIHISPVDPGQDQTPPVVNLQLEGPTNPSGSYLEQVKITVLASDEGGSLLASVQYSLDNGPLQPYASPLTITTAGAHTIQAKAIDGNGNETTSSVTAFSIEKTTPANGKIFLENQDKFPALNRLTFSRIRDPFRHVGSNFAQSHDTVVLRLHNKGYENLQIQALNLSNPGAFRIARINGNVYDPNALPLSIAPRGQIDLMLIFTATDAANTWRVKVFHETLTILSNDREQPLAVAYLHGILQRRGEGGNEPYVSEMIDAFGFKTITGFTNRNGTHHTPLPNSDEIYSSYFLRADLTKPITVRQLGAYHTCCTQTESIRWEARTGYSGSGTFLTHTGVDAQSLLPRKNDPGRTAGMSNISPSVPFSLKIGGDCTDPSRNNYKGTITVNGQVYPLRGARVWKARDAKGNIIPNAYFISHDYLNSTSNYDYNDNLYYLTNLRPEAGPDFSSELAASPSAVDFGTQTVGALTSLPVEIQNTGDAANGDPAVSIVSVTIAGQHAGEFRVVGQVPATLAAGASVSITVGFNPGSVGIRNAALLVEYNNGLSPLRIPLYGQGQDSCNTITVVKRIKSAATSASGVVINGKSFESDVPYRKPANFVKLDNTSDVSSAIAGTEDDALYRSYLSSTGDLQEMRYEVPLPAGDYFVRLHFVENAFSAPGSRVFSVLLENQLQLANLDIFQQVGYKTALVKDFNVATTDGTLNINFRPSVNRLALAGIEIFTSSAACNPAARVRNEAAPQIAPESFTLQLYPIPARESLVLALEGVATSQITALTVTDIVGRIHAVPPFQVMSPAELTFSVGVLPAGTYFLKVQAGNRFQLVRFVKQ